MQRKNIFNTAFKVIVISVLLMTTQQQKSKHTSTWLVIM